jgi:hypothetical protein
MRWVFVSLHFTDEETEAREDWLPCSRAPSEEAAGFLHLTRKVSWTVSWVGVCFPKLFYEAVFTNLSVLLASLRLQWLERVLGFPGEEMS